MIELYETSNIALAAALQCYGVYLDSVRCNDRRGIFVFKDVRTEYLERFDEGKLLVDPTMFQMYVRRLTTIAKKVAADNAR
jgi:hypothetical protein